MYSTRKSVVLQCGVAKKVRQVVRNRPAAIAPPMSNRHSVNQPQAMSGGGGGGCHTGPPPRKPTGDQEPERPASRMEPLLGSLTAKELVSLLGTVVGSVVVALGLMSFGQGPGWRAAPLNDILKCGGHTANRAVDTFDHITVHRTDTRFALSYMKGAFVVAAALVRRKDGDNTPSDRMLAGIGAATAMMLYSAIKSKDK